MDEGLLWEIGAMLDARRPSGPFRFGVVWKGTFIYNHTVPAGTTLRVGFSPENMVVLPKETGLKGYTLIVNGFDLQLDGTIWLRFHRPGEDVIEGDIRNLGSHLDVSGGRMKAHWGPDLTFLLDYVSMNGPEGTAPTES